MPENVRVSLKVRVQPGAKRSEIVNWLDGTLRVRIAAPPVDGRANEALIAFVADLLSIPKSRVQVKAGHGGRDKVLAIDGMTREELMSRLPRPD